MRARLLVVLAVVLLAAMLPQTIFAAAAGQQAAPEGGLGFLAAGVFAVWVVFFVYAFYVERKNRDLQRELEDLRRSSR